MLFFRLRAGVWLQVKAIVVCVALLASALSVAASATEDAATVRDLLKRMSYAVRELDYQGLFTYEHGGALNTLQVAHAVRDGVEYEKLQHLNGPEQELLSHGPVLKCSTPGESLVRNFGRQLDPSNLKAIESVYHFYLRPGERIADREALVLQAVPRDDYRYGLTLSLDSETGLPLKSLLVGGQRRVLERFQFLQIAIGQGSADAALKATSADARQLKRDVIDCQAGKTSPDNWQLSWLPQGFVFSGADKHNGRDSLSFTDGLSSFSVFVEMERGVPVEGRAQRGGTVAYMHRATFRSIPYRVTVVGEVPPVTAQRVAQAVRPAADL